MNEDEIRIKIYEYLGLEIGSLASESGNDWQIAKKEVLSALKEEATEKILEDKKQDFKYINKSDEDYIVVLNTNSPKLGEKKNIIATRDDLIDSEINTLILTGSKETIFNLIRFQKLTIEQIDMIIPTSVYLSKKYLMTNQELTLSHKTKLLDLMKKNLDIYKNEIIELEKGLRA